MDADEENEDDREIEISHLIIRRLLDKDGEVVVNISTSEELPLIDALGLAAFAQTVLPELYDSEYGTDSDYGSSPGL